MKELLKNKKILLGVTGSIAAYKAPLLVRELIKSGAEVRTIMTPSSINFVSPMILANLSRNAVISDMFDKSVMDRGAWHIEAANWADAMLIAPCSASTLGKIAGGVADNALVAVTLALQHSARLVISPAMDTNMWLHPATQRNARQIAADGGVIIPPAEGSLASGLVGPGRMPEIDVILEALGEACREQHAPNKTCPRCGRKFFCNHEDVSRCDCAKIPLSNEAMNYVSQHYSDCLCNDCLKAINEKISVTAEKDASDIKIEYIKATPKISEAKFDAELELEQLKQQHGMADNPLKAFYNGKRVLIDAGPTHEKIDDVRYIANSSSGKMGYAIANAAKQLGAEVVLVSGPVDLPSPAGVQLKPVVSAGEMYDEVMSALPFAEVIILAAAVADFTLSENFSGKLKKENVGDVLELRLTRTKDILASVGKNKSDGQFLAGFALEAENGIENGRKKLTDKNCDMIVVNLANKPDSGFRSDNNTITIIGRDGSLSPYPPMSKDLVALEILKKIFELNQKDR